MRKLGRTSMIQTRRLRPFEVEEYSFLEVILPLEGDFPCVVQHCLKNLNLMDFFSQPFASVSSAQEKISGIFTLLRFLGMKELMSRGVCL